MDTATVTQDDNKLHQAGLTRVPTFAELKERFSACMFIDKINNFTATFNWTDKEAVNAALNALKGKARTWHESTVVVYVKVFDTYSKFEGAFLQCFKPSKNSGTGKNIAFALAGAIRISWEFL